MQYDYYHTKAEDNRISIVPIMPNRGLILDRSGTVLARNYSAYTLEIFPGQGHRPGRRPSTSLRSIVEIRPSDRIRFKRLLIESKGADSVPIRTRLTDEEVARFAVNRYRFPGVDIRARLFRQYPLDEVASHVIGYIGRINERDAERIDDEGLSANYKGTDHIGKTGLEQSYEDELHGNTGYEQVEVDSAGRGVRTLSRTPPTPGNNLVLTLDIKLQEVAEQAFGDEPRRAGRDRSVHRRHPCLRLQARLRPQPVRRRHRPGELGCAQQLAGSPDGGPRAGRNLSARLHLQTLHGAGGAAVGQTHAAIYDQ